MYLELLPEAGKFYKVNMHCHTTVTDGKTTPEETKQLYMQKGYSAVCFTDHELLLGHEYLCDENFVALHGYEVGICKTGRVHDTFSPTYHINLIAKSQKNVKMPYFYEGNPIIALWEHTQKLLAEQGQYDALEPPPEYTIEWINGFLKRANDAGFLAVYNHPQWSLHNACDYLGLEGLHGLELINGGGGANFDNTSIHYEQLLRAGKHVVPVAGDDNHGPAGMGRAWTMIKAPELSYDALIAAFERGDCYASHGPEIKGLVLRDGKICVKTSPCAMISLYSQGRYIRRIPKPADEILTDASFDYLPARLGSFFRIEVTDERGRRAFSNAYFTADIETRLQQ